MYIEQAYPTKISKQFTTFRLVELSIKFYNQIKYIYIILIYMTQIWNPGRNT